MVAPIHPPAPEPQSDPSGLISPRSVLYSLRPIGLGTGMVESLRSLFCRLASAHCVSVPDLWRFIRNHYRIDGSPAGQSIAIKGERAHALADALSQLTAIQGVHRTTLNPLQSNTRICIRVRDERAWCPLCLVADHQPHDRLVWDISTVRHCPEHLIPLQTRCPRCGRPQRLFRPSSELRHCISCGEDLAANAPRTPYPFADPFEGWTAIQTSNAIQHYDFRKGDHAVFLENCAKAVQALGGLKPAARRLGVGLSSLRSWRAGEINPGLEGVLRLSWATQTPLVELFSQPLAEFKPRAQFPLWRPRQYRQAEASERNYLNALETFLRQHPFEVPSSLMLQRAIGGSHRHPELNQPAIQKALNVARRRRLLLRRRHTVWLLICRTHRAFRACLENGRPLTIRNLCEFGAFMRKPITRRYFLSLRQQHATGREVPNPHDRLPPDVVGYWTHLGLM